MAANEEARTHDVVGHQEVSSSEMSKWNEMIDVGISQYIRAHPDRLYRRVRRGIPERVRWQVWKAAVRVQDYDVPTKDYPVLSTRENTWTPLIEVDVGRTFPDLKAFDVSQQQRLLRVLNAYAAYNPSVGYCQGMNFIAGLLLLVSEQNEEESFAVLVCLMDNPQYGLSGFYRGRLPLLHRYLHACDRLVAEIVPELREHFIKEGVQPAVYLHQWFLTLFINCFPLSMVMIIWDVIVCEGLPVILRISVSILQVLKDSLLSMHLEEIIKFFKMMKTYDDEDGELNAFRIGQLLIKHTEHVQIPNRTLEYLNREPLVDDDSSLYPEESWEADLNGGSWMQSLSRMFTFGSTRRRSTTSVVSGDASNSAAGAAAHRAASAPELASQSVAFISSTGSAGTTTTPVPSSSMPNPSSRGSPAPADLVSSSGASGYGRNVLGEGSGSGSGSGDGIRGAGPQTPQTPLQKKLPAAATGESVQTSFMPNARHSAARVNSSNTNSETVPPGEDGFATRSNWECL